MKKIFFGLTGGLGPILRSLPIANYYQQAGMEVFFSMYDEKNSKLVERSGYKVLIDDDPTMPDPQYTIPASPLFLNLDQYYAQSGFLDVDFTRSWVLSRIKMLKDNMIDLVFADLSPHTVIAARYLGIPVVSILQSCFHPQGEKLIPLEYYPDNLPTVTPVFNTILKELKLNTVSKMEELLSGNIDIIPSIPELDPVQHKNAKYVGPIEIDVQTGHNEEMTKERTILVYPGRLKDTSGDSGVRLIQTIVDGFRGKEELVYIATDEEIPSEIAYKIQWSKNLKIIPHYSSKLLKSSDLFIHHGGHGSCLSSITNKVPSLVIPTHSERFFNARKVKEVGVGEYLLMNTFTPDLLYNKAKDIMNNLDFKLNLLQLNETIETRGYTGAYQVFKLSRSLINL
ncbi:glycosyltransferase [Cytobacillus pseudoceanisediminis]|uniref:glycosyltransferase n=1 Tax=Cytobacillus pseudoceanisediminis TaxID=3051614 RepID=UPI003C2D1CF2